MELAECIRRDRATREFAERAVDRSTVEALVDSARRAGSGHNRQPWTFVAVRDPDRRMELAEFGSYTTPLRNAPLGIVVAVDESDSHYRHEHNVFDCGRAAQNLMLAATDRGLGTCPQGFGDREGAHEFLGLPEGTRVLMGFAVGHPAAEESDTIEGVDKDEELHHPGRRPVEDLLHWERYEDEDEDEDE
jgi:nitroreductase